MTTTEETSKCQTEEEKTTGSSEDGTTCGDEKKDVSKELSEANVKEDSSNISKESLRVEHLEKVLNIDIKTLCNRTDVSAFNKVNMILEIINKTFPPEKEEKADEMKEETKKRPADVDETEEPKPKTSKPDEDVAKPTDEEKKTEEKKEGEDSDEEGKDIDSCVVCGLYLSVFGEQSEKELHHYLSHGFNILKEFEILKPDDSLFLVCNICGNPFPRKCHGNFRKHLVSEHQERIIEIFREF